MPVDENYHRNDTYSHDEGIIKPYIQ
jgi:hypothetical protein